MRNRRRERSQRVFPFISIRFDVSRVSFQLLSLPFRTPPCRAPLLSPKLYWVLEKWFISYLNGNGSWKPREKLQAELH